MLGSQAAVVSGRYFLNFSLSYLASPKCVFKEIMVFFAVSGGLVSLVQGSYEYYHYLQDGFDDSVCLLSRVKLGLGLDVEQA